MLQSVEEERASGGAASVPQLEGAPARDIVFEDVTFRYGAETPAVFEHLNLRIRAGEAIGVAGQNGSGKSSFADLLLGLLAPTSGRILADGIDIGGRNRAAWQATVAYVPQHVALIDGTVMENIALGLAPEDVDQARLEAAMRIARVDEFVATFPQGYRTLLGEQGVQLSGGQRQRLGIARALYRRATLLVMDEATASLDVTAEREITSALHEHAGFDDARDHRAPAQRARRLRSGLPSARRPFHERERRMRVSRVDPFGERQRRTWRRRYLVLGARVDFECETAALAAVVDAAYAGLPVTRARRGMPVYRVCLRFMADDTADFRGAPPCPRFSSGGGLISATIDASNYSVVAPAVRSALVVASPAMLARPYDLRCELLEFAVFTLVARDQPVLPLHAACVGVRDRAVLLLGESGAGKSTATLQCMLAGLGVLAEDVVFVEPRRLTVTGVPNYIHLRLETPRLLPAALARRIRRAPVIERRNSGVRKYEVDLRGTASAKLLLPASLVAVVVLSRARSRHGGTLLRELPARELLRALDRDQPYARSRPFWRTLRASLRRLPKFRLERGAAAADTATALAALLTAR